jgi:hypothetical protein
MFKRDLYYSDFWCHHAQKIQYNLRSNFFDDVTRFTPLSADGAASGVS